MRNIELKARLSNRKKSLSICENLTGASFAGDIRQTDTYFKVPQGRFKLRICEPGETYLVYYHRENRADAKASDYTIEHVQPSILGILSESLGIVAEVKKIRTLYLWENVRIHLDRVEDLGDFLEFEAVLGEEDSDSSGFQKVERLKRLFEIRDEDLIEGSYLEMKSNPSQMIGK